MSVKFIWMNICLVVLRGLNKKKIIVSNNFLYLCLKLSYFFLKTKLAFLKFGLLSMLDSIQKNRFFVELYKTRVCCTVDFALHLSSILKRS